MRVAVACKLRVASVVAGAVAGGEQCARIRCDMCQLTREL